MQNDIELIEGTAAELREVYPLFEAAFPANERKSCEHLEGLLQKKRYRLLLAKHAALGVLIGYALVFDLPRLNALWLDYMAIDEGFRNGGYGSLLFRKIAGAEPKTSIGVFLEVEIPEDNADHASNEVRRIRFYERLGAVKLDVDYRLPTEGGGYPMHLYFRPAPGLTLLPKESIREAIISVYNYIHTDIPNRDGIAKSFLDSAKDARFL